MKQIPIEQRIAPLRGLVLLENHRGRPFAQVDVRRWMRLNRIAHKTPKIDVYTRADGCAARLDELIAFAASLDMRLSLRTACTAPPPDLAALEAPGLLDVFLCPSRADAVHLQAWLQAARDAQLSVRLQIPFSLHGITDLESWADHLAGYGVTVVNIACDDPFVDLEPCADAAQSRAALDRINQIAPLLDARGVEVNLLGIPFCWADQDNHPFVVDRAQFFADHQHYRAKSYELAEIIDRRSPLIASKTLLMLLTQVSLMVTPFDARLLPWLLKGPRRHMATALHRRLTKHLSLFRSAPRPGASLADEVEKQHEKTQQRQMRRLGPRCSRCDLRRICDNESKALAGRFPGIAIEPIETGELVTNPLHFSAGRAQYYDGIDAQAVERDVREQDLADRATKAVNARPPDRQLSSRDYTIEGTHFDTMEGGVRWHSVSNIERTTTSLARLETPFMLSATFCGGFADYIGFNVGRDARLYTTMDAPRHELALYVEGDGRYVMLRDGRPVRPVEFANAYYTPERLSDVIEPRLCAVNIDGSIVTHNISIWEDGDDVAALEAVKYSVIIVCSRYARRLQATLSSLVHQQDFDLRTMEIVVSYIPGIDATGDVLDSIHLAFPQLRIVRSAFSERNQRAKGFQINESVQKASGEWIVLLDADIICPPDLFRKIEDQGDDHFFVAPEGRKMLDLETSSKILLGEIQPWTCFQKLLKGPGEYRTFEAGGVPVGFCQCVRAEAFEKTPYAEFEHFESADMYFAFELINQYGPPLRLSGTPVLHLDHGGSQWYGTNTHR